MTKDTVEVMVKLKFKVWVGGSFADPQYDGQKEDSNGLYQGPTKEEAVDSFLYDLTIKKHLFSKEKVAEVLEISDIKTIESVYMSGE